MPEIRRHAQEIGRRLLDLLNAEQALRDALTAAGPEAAAADAERSMTAISDRTNRAVAKLSRRRNAQ